MNLAQPGWLLLALLALLLAFLHRQRRAHRAAEVGSLHLWRRLGAEHAPERARRLPRMSAALLLQLLVLGLVALALARPSLERDPAGRGTPWSSSTPPARCAPPTCAPTASAPPRGRRPGGWAGGSPCSSWAITSPRSRWAGTTGRRCAGRCSAHGPRTASRTGRRRAVWCGPCGEGQPRVVALVAPSGATSARSALAGLGAEVRTVGGGHERRPHPLRGHARGRGSGLDASRSRPPVRPARRAHADRHAGRPDPRAAQAGPRPGAGPSLLPELHSRPGRRPAGLLDADALPADDTAQVVLRPSPFPYAWR